MVVEPKDGVQISGVGTRVPRSSVPRIRKQHRARCRREPGRNDLCAPRIGARSPHPADEAAIIIGRVSDCRDVELKTEILKSFARLVSVAKQRRQQDTVARFQIKPSRLLDVIGNPAAEKSLDLVERMRVIRIRIRPARDRNDAEYVERADDWDRAGHAHSG